MQVRSEPLVCNGDYWVANQAELDAVSECSEITGDLHIESALTTLDGLESLTGIGGHLYIEDNEQLYMQALEVWLATNLL